MGGTPVPAIHTISVAGVGRPVALNVDEYGSGKPVLLLHGDVAVVGNSFGGWVAAELALLNPTRLSEFDDARARRRLTG
jgi:hypothetical protein